MTSGRSSSRCTSVPPCARQRATAAASSRCSVHGSPAPVHSAPSAEPVQDLLVGQVEGQHGGERPAGLAQRRVERGGLVRVARIAVEQEALSGGTVVEAGAQDAVDQAVRHQRAALDEGAPPRGRARCRRRSPRAAARRSRYAPGRSAR